MKFSVALIYGGEGAEHDISVVSAKNLGSFIDTERFSLIRIYISRDGSWFIKDGENEAPTFPVRLDGESGFLCEGKIIPTDIAIISLHGDMGEDGVIAGALSTAHIPFIGCKTAASSAAADKIITKMIAEAIGIPTAKWTFSNGEDSDKIRKRAEALFGYPMFIKPSTLGSSIGISRVCSAKEFDAAYRKALSYGKRVLIEEAVPVKVELECAFLGARGKSHFAVGEILSGGKFYDFSEKYGESSSTKTTLGELLPSHLRDKTAEYAARLREAIFAEGLARFDFFLTDGGEILFNEINTFPGMTPTSLFPLLTEKMGLLRGEFINLLLSEALL